MKQHRVPETYWNQFCFLNGEMRKLSILEKGKHFTSSTTVKSFTREKDIFNILRLGDNKFILENYFRDIETKYPTVIEKINAQKEITDEDKCSLIYFFITLICRSKQNIDLIQHLINTDKEGLVNEITCMLNDPLLKRGLLVEDELNVFAGVLMMHFAEVLIKTFSGKILVSYSNKYWLTSNNPAVWDMNNNYSYLITPDTEFYLPLNPTYCLYLYHPKSTITNIIKDTFIEGKLYQQCDSKQHDFVINKISNNDFEYLVCPVNLGRVDLSQKNVP